MKLKLITVAFDPESGGFPQEPLCDVEGEVLSVIEHFFEHSGARGPRYGEEPKARQGPNPMLYGPPDCAQVLTRSSSGARL